MRSLRCGTNAGYVAHQAAGTPACDDCKAARRQYMQRYRAGKPKAALDALAHQALRSRALTVLGQRHADELEQIVHDLGAS